jgi:hypothetical protein
MSAVAIATPVIAFLYSCYGNRTNQTAKKGNKNIVNIR